MMPIHYLWYEKAANSTYFSGEKLENLYPIHFRRASEASTVFTGADLEVYPIIEDEDDIQAFEVYWTIKHCIQWRNDTKNCTIFMDTPKTNVLDAGGGGA